MKNLLKNKILIIIILAALARVGFIFYYVDLKDEVFYLEYGNISKNLIAGNGYSLFHFENDKMEYKFDEKAKPFPTAYMPPGFVYLTSPFFLINDVKTRNIIIFLFNISLSCIVIYLLYKLVLMIFNQKTALIAALIYTFLPEFIFTTSSFGTTLVYHLFIISIFIIFLKFRQNSKAVYAYSISLLCTALTLFRIEFLLISGILVLYFLYKKHYKFSIGAFLILILALSPWVIRNYTVFDKILITTTSGGLNLYRGHNSYRPGVWADDSIDAKIKQLPRDSKFELYFDSLYQNEAFSNIKAKGLAGEIKNTAEKIFHLWIYNPYYAKSKEPVYFVFWLVILFISIIGLTRTFSISKFNIFYLFLIYHTFLAGLYFIIPRYQTMMKPLLLPFVAFELILIWEKIKNSKNKILNKS